MTPPIGPVTPTMRISYLKADVPLAKTYTPTSKTPYPHVRDFTSLTVDVDHIDDFTAHVRTHARAGHCLLKGELQRELRNESRAGSTDANTPTSWVCLDIDRCPPGLTTPDEYIALLPAQFHQCSYLWHWSNSAKIVRNDLSGHLFFLLDTPVDPKWLKRVICSFNFLPQLTDQIHLSHNGLTLSYGLDPTTAQNDKLLFIAPPTLVGLDDPFAATDRFELVHKAQDTLQLTPTQISLQALETLIQAKINHLRKDAGMPLRKTTYKQEGDVEYLKNPDRGTFRGPYIEARGFRYGNLNDGDSYAYYHPIDQHKYLHNFKGEPIVRLQDIDPDYWRNITATPITNTPHRYFILRDRITDTYHTVDHDQATDTLETYAVGNLQKAQDFLRLHRKEIPDAVPLWDIVFEPDHDFLVDYDRQAINSYQKSAWLKNSKPSPHCPHKFAEITQHVVGNDPLFHRHLLNWLAAIIQRRQKTGTAFLLHGRTGTGKGALFHYVIKPILGAAHCPNILMEDLDTGWNDWLETGLIVLVDEAQINDTGKGAARANKIKNMISEPTLLIKRKFCNARAIKSHVNFIFAANEHDAILLVDNDRRFKIPPRQEQPLPWTQADINQLTAELQDITDYLMGYPVNDTLLQEIPITTQRQQLIDATKTPLDIFVDLITAGNYDAMMSFSQEIETVKNAVYRNKFLYLLQEWRQYLGQPAPIPVSDLRAAYNFLFGVDVGPVAFGKKMSNKNIKVHSARVNGVPCVCTTITWHSEHFAPTTPQLNEATRCSPGPTLN